MANICGVYDIFNQTGQLSHDTWWTYPSKACGGGGAGCFSRALAHILNACLVTCTVTVVVMGV